MSMSLPRYSRIAGTGSWLPPNRLTNAALAAQLEIIHRDEIGHVAIGSKWFRYICEQRKLDARSIFRQLVDEYMKGSLKGPFDEVVRMQAGFSEEELADLRAMEL